MKKNLLSLENRVAVITGSGTGIGAAMARLFADAGATVVVTGPESEKIERVATACRTGGDKAWAWPLDVTVPQSVASLFAEIDRREGRLDILVNNAAPTDPSSRKSFVEHTEADWEKFLGVIVVGAARCCSAALPLLRQTRGVILNLSSVHASLPRNAAAYGAAKAALENLTCRLAVELAPDGIRVNALAPGWIETEGIAWSLADRAETARTVAQRVPLNRLGQPEEMAQAGLFLVSDMASYVTGSTLVADGGWLVR